MPGGVLVEEGTPLPDSPVDPDYRHPTDKVCGQNIVTTGTHFSYACGFSFYGMSLCFIIFCCAYFAVSCVLSRYPFVTTQNN